VKAYPGFKSLPFRHIKRRLIIQAPFLFVGKFTLYLTIYYRYALKPQISRVFCEDHVTMKYAICILSSPSNSDSFHSSYRFTETLLKAGHQVSGIFFYHESVTVASSILCPPQDDFNAQQSWITLIEQYGLTPTICIAAGLKRGIIDEKEAKRYGKVTFNLEPHFTLGGLGELVSACADADRVITFGD
jgi:tRNA 2-thiouridine synthesizing protein D